MKQEYNYLLLIGFWIMLWSFLPWVALPLFIIVSVKQFLAYRKQRQLQEVSLMIDRERWARMEGFTPSATEPDPADWWKNRE